MSKSYDLGKEIGEYDAEENQASDILAGYLALYEKNVDLHDYARGYIFGSKMGQAQVKVEIARIKQYERGEGCEHSEYGSARENPYFKQRDLIEPGETRVSYSGGGSYKDMVPLDLPDEELLDLKENDPDAWQEIWDNNEAAREAFVKYFKGMEGWQTDYYLDGDGAGHYLEAVHGELGAMDASQVWTKHDEDLEELQKDLVEETGLADDFIHDQMMEHLLDTEAYEEGAAKGDEYRMPSSATAGLYVGDSEEQVESLKYNDVLEAIVEKLSDAELASVVCEADLEYAFERRTRAKFDHAAARDGEDPDFGAAIRKELQEHGVTYGIHIPVWVYVTLSMEKLKAIVLEVVEPYLEGTKKLPTKTPADDNKVYTFRDGFYVAELPASALRQEGRELGICVGSHGYPEKVRSGRTKIFSLRTAAGRPKFTIEADMMHGMSDPVAIRQVKGKGNRLPGFDAGGGGTFKADEVAKLAEFIRSLGIDPAGVNDMKPAMRALTDGKKTNPFPKSRRHCGFCR